MIYFPEKIVLSIIIWNRDNLRMNYPKSLELYCINYFQLQYTPFKKIREAKITGRKKRYTAELSWAAIIGRGGGGLCQVPLVNTYQSNKICKKGLNNYPFPWLFR
jgi:hypothetical protein